MFQSSKREGLLYGIVGLAVVCLLIGAILWASHPAQPEQVTVKGLILHNDVYNGRTVRIRGIYHPPYASHGMQPVVSDTADPAEAASVYLSAPLALVRPEASVEVVGTYVGPQNALVVTSAKEIGPPVPQTYTAAPPSGSLP